MPCGGNPWTTRIPTALGKSTGVPHSHRPGDEHDKDLELAVGPRRIRNGIRRVVVELACSKRLAVGIPAPIDEPGH